MDHHNFSSAFTITIDQVHDENHFSVEQPYISRGGTIALETANMLRNGVLWDSQWNSQSRPNEYPSQSFRMGARNCMPTFPGPPYGSFSHSSTVGNFVMPTENTNAHAQSCYYNRQYSHEVGGGLLNPTVDTRRGQFKRKSPEFSGIHETTSTSRFYGPGSSSGFFERIGENSVAAHEDTPSGPICLPQYRSSGLSIDGEDLLRNVRSRSRLDFDPNRLRTRLPHYSFHHHSATNLGHHSDAVDPSYVNADATNQERNVIPFTAAAAADRRVPTLDTNSSSYEINQLVLGGSTTENGIYMHDFGPGRHFASSSESRVPFAQIAREPHSSHFHGMIPTHVIGPGNSLAAHEAPTSVYGLHMLPENLSSRYAQPSLFGGWHNTCRNGRSRTSLGRFQSLPSASHRRIDMEVLTMVDRSSLHGGPQFDHFRDMRLDIDSMTYEDLVTLGERMGSVSTGLSEDMISNCLKEILYCLSQNHVVGPCAICLEDYKNKEKVGVIKNCGHEYHVECIRKWLLMKNVCPICKVAALSGDS